MITGTILIVDEDRGFLKLLEEALQSEYEKVIAISSPKRINEILRKTDVDVVLLEANYKSVVRNGNEGLYWLKEILDYDRNISVVIVTASGDIEQAVRAIKEGSVDFILKPPDRNRLLTTINNAMQLRISRLEAYSLKEDNRQLKSDQ
ncbi:MAG: response regulator [Bacteroidales bacterium]|nr:response regulator [Bacteroidales bacterium]